MPWHDPFDDGAVDALLGGTASGGDAAALASFVEDVRSAAGAVPTPSPALAAAMAAGGISVNDDPPVALWRKLRMKVQAFLAGLGVAGKVALGATIAAAAATGAGAAGVLPEPVQHAVASTFNAVSPLDMPDPGESAKVVIGEGSATDTTKPETDETTPTTKKKPPAKKAEKKEGGLVVTPTTTKETDETTPTTKEYVEDDGKDETTPTTKKYYVDMPKDTTPTTKKEQEDATPPNPESIDLACERGLDPVRIVCEWTLTSNTDHYKYKLVRWKHGHSSSVVYKTYDGHVFEDTGVDAGYTYTYQVFEIRSDGAVIAHSNEFTLACCGEPEEAEAGDA
jgi:hypothetical protein